MDQNIEYNLNILKQVEYSLTTFVEDPIEFQAHLNKLGEIVASSSQSEETRELLGSNEQVWEALNNIIDESFSILYEEPYLSLYLRLFRGALLLVRNLIVINQSISLEVLLKNIKSFMRTQDINNSFYYKTLIVYLQILANLAQVSKENEILNDIRDVFFGANNRKVIEFIDDNEELRFPFLVFFNNILSNSDNLYDLLTFEENFDILDFLIVQFKKIDIQSELDEIEHLIILIFQKIISHESYNKYLNKKDIDSKEFLNLMKLNQIVLTSKENWDNYEITSLLSWIYEFFKNFSEKSINILVSESFDHIGLSNNHLNIIILLDCLSDLSKFETAKQFLLHYNAIEELIKLLRVVHENVKRRTLKAPIATKMEDLTNTKEFPQVKSLIIEIIAYLTHSTYEVQEKIRELHGLELILSNCTIDDNNPFIKERSIVCLKFLLENNEKNQNFVANLEAKQAYDDSILKDVGYEVKIEDGKVKLKQTEKRNVHLQS